MMNNHLKVLLIEDNAGDARLIQEMLKDIATASFESEWVSSLSAGLERLSEIHFDALLLDLGLPDSKGIETLEQLLSQSPEVPVIVLTGLADEMLGIEAVQKGAQDYLVKGPVNSDLLVRAIRYAIERKRLISELRNLSLRDDLTGLYNRRGFLAVAEQQWKLAKRSKTGLLLILADLDGMKQINDTFGHKEGDLALKNAAAVLKDTFRESDVIGRIGGDEFAVVVIEDSKVGAEIISVRLQDNLDAYNAKRIGRYELSVSIGIARCDPASPCFLDKLMSEADALMYEQKRRKKICAVDIVELSSISGYRYNAPLE
jgi:diguanylate cyclase (GGDEF)-like protein